MEEKRSTNPFQSSFCFSIEAVNIENTSIKEQVYKIVEEVNELLQEIKEDKVDLFKVNIESMDIVTAVIGLYALQHLSEKEVSDLIAAVRFKNSIRGYYGNSGAFKRELPIECSRNNIKGCHRANESCWE